MSLQIRKKTDNTWVHIKNNVSVILSKGFFKIQDDMFELTEPSGVDQFRGSDRKTLITDITVYDDTDSGSPEVYTSAVDLVNRLRALTYPYFGDFVINISAEESSGATTVQTFTATADQTDFIVNGSPTTITVFSGRNLAIPSVDYNYSGGTITFTSGRILGTIITVIVY